MPALISLLYADPASGNKVVCPCGILAILQAEGLFKSINEILPSKSSTYEFPDLPIALAFPGSNCANSP